MVEGIKIPKGYKQTDVGVIPEDWIVKKIEDFTYATAGGTPSTSINEYWGGNILWMSSGELNYKRIYDVQGRITELGLDNSATKYIPSNSVLIGLAGQGKTRGTVAINYVELCTNQSIAAILPNQEVDSEYLFQNLEHRYLELRNLSSGDGGRGGLNLKLIYRLKIPLPPTKAEQTAIAKALIDMDALIGATEKLIAKKRSIKQGAMQELLKPKEGWEVKTMDEIGKTYGGLSGKAKKDFENGTKPYIPFMNVMSNPIIDTSYFDYVVIDSSESQNKVQKGDLFFNTSSETPEEVGMCSVLLDNIKNLYLNSFCFGFRFYKEIKDNGLYLSYCFRSNYGREKMLLLAQGATRYNLSKINFLKLEIELPKPEEQTRIAQILSHMDSEIEKLETQLSKYKMLKTGMMQNLLTGRIRLV